MKYTYYTDGACSGNGTFNSSGGWGVVEIDENNNIIWQSQGTKSPTTNNEMELTAILNALNHIKEENNFIQPILYTDSAYCCNLINTWMYSWERNGWMRPKNQEVKNLEIIKEIFQLAKLADIKKIPGHSGVEWNEYVDKLAKNEITI
ncbi:MAG: ribonuclease HI [Clostridia bacterium]|nr:ribonuclease HI [Clostridia bacterium]